MKNIVVFDLDGTLADCSQRIHHILKEKKDWDSFFKDCLSDKPIQHMIGLPKLFGTQYKVVIVTGRSDIAKEETEIWLKENDVYYDSLYMREQGDHTDDDVLKLKMVESFKEKILFVFEDRNRVVKMWRDAGIPCFHVAEGDF